MAEFEQILNEAKDIFDNNKQDKIDEYTRKLNNILVILKQKQINYDIAKEAIKLHKDAYTVLPSLVNETYIQKYNELKQVIENENASSQEYLNRLVEIFKIEAAKCKNYLDLKNLYQLNGVISDISFPDGTSVNVISSKNTTIEYAGQTYTYNYPTEVSFDIDIKKEYYITKLVSRSPAFGSNTHDEEARLYVDILNAVKGFNQDEPDKKDLIYHRNELNKVFGANQKH